MKKTVLLFIIAICSLSVFGQKPKALTTKPDVAVFDSVKVVPISKWVQADIDTLQKKMIPLQKDLEILNVQMNTIIKTIIGSQTEPVDLNKIKSLKYAPGSLELIMKE